MPSPNVRKNPDAWGPARQACWTRIDLVKDDDGPAFITPQDVALLVSDDNEHYRPYQGPLSRRELIEDYPVYRCGPCGPVPGGSGRKSRVFRFEGLDLRTPFVALVVNNGGQRSFSNRLCDLVHIYGEKGEETHLTYALSPRVKDWAGPFSSSPVDAGAALSDASAPAGFEFNRYPGTPSSYLRSGGDPINLPLALDRGGVSYLALARGKDRGPLAALSPSFPQTRGLWLSWVRAMLDAGADGIDIRPGHHHADFAWGEYGFESPVREAMLRQSGQDIWTTDRFDHELWRRLRGQGWTDFIQEASALVRSRGKTLSLHIDDHFDGAPGRGGAMNMTCDWRAWLTRELIDRVTGKALWPHSSLALDVLEGAHAQGIDVTYAPYCNNFFEGRRSTNHVGDSPPGCQIPVNRLIQEGKAGGFDGFVFYECASALRAAEDGSIRFRSGAEPLQQVMRSHFVL